MKLPTRKIRFGLTAAATLLTAGILLAQSAFFIEPEPEVPAFPQLELLPSDYVPEAGTFFLLE